ncbi:amino acid ABC transporter permease [Microbacterium sp. cx-59]|uniref:amino acid ABC transporter permease n=1 Tax=Microbacterium sp. cx-59 TaxID=2891207 RepID=UPI001E461150|nr:amino acid ABC transporter permease [Microbacterium sp. cx-59]MCC4908899.1 amino acid ABC transporter permease [Microbacterium sp. cx-59]
MIEILGGLSRGIGTTVAITLLSFALGSILAIPLVALRRSPKRVLRWTGAAAIEVIRSIPPIVWLMFIFLGVGSDLVRLDTFQAAVAGFSIISAAYIAEIYRSAIDAVPAGQWEAAKALSLRTLPTYVRVILPQAVLLMIPASATYLIGLFKDSAIASVIGAQDITFFAFQSARITGEGLTVFLLAAAMYLVLSIPVAIIARASGAWVERKLVR